MIGTSSADIPHQSQAAITKPLLLAFFRVTLNVSARFPSLRWNIPLSKFGFAALFRYIRDNFVLDSKLRKIKRLHYSIVKEQSNSFVLVPI